MAEERHVVRRLQERVLERDPLLVPVEKIQPADIQDRDGAVPLLRAARRLFPFVEVIFADGAYRGAATAASVAETGRWRLEIVSRGDAKGFVPLAKRWIVERTFAWLGRCRRLAKDFENLAVNALAFLCLGMIRLMLRRLARYTPAT
jgi:transposase